ncbi:MAG TPA: ABC transporter permease [Dehalococcoidia bacterium]|nr:ABC transporter permease [Dehalococcoidia bacterium]
MGSFLSVIPIVVRRVAANWRLLTAVIIGAILASALMSTTSIYTDAIRDLGLDHAIREQGPDKINIAIRSSTHPSAQETWDKDVELVNSSSNQLIGPLLDGQMTATARSETYYAVPPGGSVPAAVPVSQLRSFFQFITNLEQHIKVTDGRLPGNATAPATGAPNVEVALGAATASRLNLKLGDRFDLIYYNAVTREPVHATLVGIIEPVNKLDPFWVGQTDFFSFVSSGWETLPFFVSQDTYFKAIAPYQPNMTSDLGYFVYLKTDSLNARNAEQARASLNSFRLQIEGSIPRTNLTTQLSEVLATFDQKLFFTKIPLLVLVLQIAAIVLYYLFMVSTMLVERQAGEISLLKSRGATTAQVMQIYVIEGLAIFGVALAVGPPLAMVVIGLLGHTPPFQDLSGGHNLSVHLTPDAYLWALSGAVLAFVMLLGPAYLATRRTVVQQRTASARPPKEPAFTRYYLDLVLVGIGAVLFYQLDRRGTLVTNDFFGDQSVDPVSLLTPAFFILTVGIVFLRVFPLVLRVLAWVVARMQGTSILIGMWQLVRNPVHYSRLVLLLMLATAVGMFAASFGATLNRSYADRAAYESGGGLRLTQIHKVDASGPPAMGEALKTSTEAEAATAAMRQQISTGAVLNRISADILGVDPATFGEVAYYRGDFSDNSLESMMALLAEDKPGGAKELQLPAGSRWLGLWVNPTDLNGSPGLDIRVRDAAGRYYSYNLGPEVGAGFLAAQREMAKGWNFLIADMSKPQSPSGAQSVVFPAPLPQEPLTVISISVRFQTRISALNGGMQIDDLVASPDATLPGNLGVDRTVVDNTRTAQPFKQSTTVLNFDSTDDWEVLQGMAAVRLADELTRVAIADGGFLANVSWRQVPQTQPQTHGIRVKVNTGPVSVLASQSFLDKTNFKIGDIVPIYLNGTFFDVKIVDSYELFPTLKDPRKDLSLVANGLRLEQLVNANPRGTTTYMDEIWLKEGESSAALAQKEIDEGTLQATLVSFAELREIQQKDPLIAAGWEGILFLSFAAILLLSAIGFLIYSYLTAQKRTLEFAVLRTMGFSRRQIATVVGFEQLFVIGLGMIAGTLMGLRLGSLMIRYMGLSETGDEVVPPMSLHVSWFTIGSAWIVLALVFLVTIGFVVLLYSRLALHKVLRIGET